MGGARGAVPSSRVIVQTDEQPATRGSLSALKGASNENKSLFFNIKMGEILPNHGVNPSGGQVEDSGACWGLLPCSRAPG